MSNAMELSQDTLQQIGEYVKRHLPEWQRETSAGQEPAAGLSQEMVRREIELGERIVRVEEELKTQRDLIREGFAGVNKRFEEQTAHFEKRFEDQLSYFNTRFEEQTASTNARFDDVNKRFEDMRTYTNRWMMLISLFLGLIGAMPWIMGAY